ncbi:MAG TPA: glycerol-3-phosphate acyltransferase [Acidimicrobiia bacterium]|jgi:glycerol-3-phosphate acyltransferase PlsY|nr:glycerol-3-phosphate acyltransferase [Acidimicrobiia bacterium]
MTLLAAALAGYFIGSVPTAVWLGRLWGVDLLRDGSGNAGANNARRLGGYTLAVLVLVIEIGKGLAAVVVGLVIGGEGAALAAGVSAVAGNVYNVWYRFQGGKGFGISGGVILGLWPAVFPFAVVILALASALTRSTGIGSLVTLGALLASALAWERTGLDSPWGLADPTLLVVMVIGLGLIVVPRHWQDARDRLRSPVPP